MIGYINERNIISPNRKNESHAYYNSLEDGKRKFPTYLYLYLIYFVRWRHLVQEA